MNERTRFQEERGQGVGRRVKQLTAQVKEWARSSSPGFIGAAWQLVGTLNDSIRSGQYDLGMPYIYTRCIDVLPGETTPLSIPCKKYGVIQSMTPLVTNLENAPQDIRLEAGVTRIEIGAQTFFEAQDNTLFRPTSVFTTGFVPSVAGNGQPQDFFGFLRRIPIAQGDDINVLVRNFSANDTYQIGLAVVQYGMLPPNLVNAG